MYVYYEKVKKVDMNYGTNILKFILHKLYLLFLTTFPIQRISDSVKTLRTDVVIQEG